jgi:hypothetical protein
MKLSILLLIGIGAITGWGQAVECLANTDDEFCVNDCNCVCLTAGNIILCAANGITCTMGNANNCEEHCSC